VRVVLRIEGAPRWEAANEAVLDTLRRRGLEHGLWVHRSRFKAHLHSKIYCFSHPRPCAFVGSFNPSGDDPELHPEVIEDIGDQDRGHNLLVELAEPGLAQGLCAHVLGLHQPFARLRHVRPLTNGETTAWFFPRLGSAPVHRLLPTAAQIVGCISHLKEGAFTRHLLDGVEQGATVRLVVHDDTARRVPEALLGSLREQGVDVRRFVHPDRLPMHAKFLVIDGTAWFGSFNFNRRSRWVNREILLASRRAAIVGPLLQRFEEIWQTAR
jgi:hypothetical protein